MAKREFTPYLDMTDEQKRAFHVAGGKARAAAIKKRKELREYLLALLDSDTNTGDVAGDMCWALIQKALSGDVKAFETIRSTIGQDSPQKVELETNTIKVELEDDDN